MGETEVAGRDLEWRSRFGFGSVEAQVFRRHQQRWGLAICYSASLSFQVFTTAFESQALFILRMIVKATFSSSNRASACENRIPASLRLEQPGSYQRSRPVTAESQLLAVITIEVQPLC